MGTCASDTQFAIFPRAGHCCEVVIITVVACTNAIMLSSAGGVNPGRWCIVDRHHCIRTRMGSRRSKAVWRLAAARHAASYDAHVSGIRGRGARPAYGAKESALGRHGRRHGALALKVLTEP